MLEYVKKLFRSYWVLSVFCIILGIALIVKPDFFTNVLGYAVGGLLAGYGIIQLVRYFAKVKENPMYATGLAAGVIFCAAGVFILARPDFIPKIIAVIFGVYMLISGIINFQDALGLRRAGVPKWTVSAVPACLTIAVGAVLVINPLFLTDAALMVLGISLLVSGVSNIAGCFSAARFFHSIKRPSGVSGNSENEDDVVEFIDVD